MSPLQNQLWQRFGLYAPRVELARFKKIDFFPRKPDLLNLRSICIGSKTRTIGDVLVQSTLARKLRAKYPHLEVYTYPRGFNPAVFYNNPAIEGLKWLPEALYGDDCNEGPGHLIQKKERFFGLEVSQDVRPEIILSKPEREWPDRVRHGLSLEHRPVCVLHPWGKTNPEALSESFWEELVQSHSSRISFWQVGIEGHRKIAGCDQHFLLPRAYREARKLFAIIRRAKLFIGIDSGPMHVARAFGLKALVFIDTAKPVQEIFADRDRTEKTDPRFSFLYEENENAGIQDRSKKDLLELASSFLS